jgi:dipeptidyl aminopeptidase/acylaminoacyl peptidase
MPAPIFASLLLSLASNGTAAESATDVRPTLEEIFRPPRLLGVRPQRVSISASGRFALWRFTDVDAEEPKLEWWIAEADGSGAARRLFPAEPKVELVWGPRGEELYVRRGGWIERMDLAGDGVARPLFECGENASQLAFTRDGGKAVFVTGEDNELWVLDLASGARASPARSLASRGRWFQVIDGIDAIALFAAAPGAEAPAPAAAASSAPAAAAATPPPAPAAPARQEPPRRVLWFAPLSAGGEARATRLEESGGVEISADGRFAAIARFEPEAKRQLVVADFLTDTVTTVPARSSLAGDPAAKAALALYDFGKEERFEPAIDEGSRYMLLDASWSPAGARLLVQRVSGDHHSRQILVFDADERRASPLFSERDDAWIGGPMLLAAWRSDASEAIFSSEQSGFCHLHAAPAEGGEPRALTGGEFEVLEATLLEDGLSAVLLTNELDPAERTLALLDLASGERRLLPTPRGCVTDFVVSRDGSRVAFLREDLGVPADVWAVATDPQTAGPVQLSDTAPAALRELELPPPEIVEFANAADGTRLRALLYRPQPLVETRPGPAVVFVHGAGYLQNVTRSMTAYPVNMLFHHRLARMGFTVLDVDYRHSAGYGRAFRTAVYGHMGGKDLDDEVAGAEYLKSLRFVDGSRIGIYGGSYGGFLTLMALFTRPELFACGAALRSVTDWRSYGAHYTNARLGDPKVDAENYRRSSPIDHAEGLKKPLLLLHGLKDGNVFAQDTIRLIEKLIQLGKEFDAMLYPSQDHAFTDPESWIDEYRRIERLFLRELKPAPGGRAPGIAPRLDPTRPRPL